MLRSNSSKEETISFDLRAHYVLKFGLFGSSTPGLSPVMVH